LQGLLYSSRIARKCMVLFVAKPHQEREQMLCSLGPKACEWCAELLISWRKQGWGAGDCGVARQPETEVLQGCQMVEKASVSADVCGGGGRPVWVCQCVGCVWYIGES
jgi:hypothetical protein